MRPLGCRFGYQRVRGHADASRTGKCFVRGRVGLKVLVRGAAQLVQGTENRLEKMKGNTKGLLGEKDSILLKSRALITYFQRCLLFDFWSSF